MLRAAPARGRRLRIADIGTGSACDLVGAYCLSCLRLADSAPDIMRGCIANRSTNAAAWASPRAMFRRLRLCGALSGPFDLIVSNPPYIRSAEIADLAIEVRDHDPSRLWTAATDGLDVSGAGSAGCAATARAGALVVEMGYGKTGKSKD